MAYWLMKSEPDVFSIDHLRQRKVAGWDGVRNYQARNHLRAMRCGDEAFFYHSSTAPPAVVGRMTIVREAHPDPTQFERSKDAYDPASTKEKPRWDQVEVKFGQRFAHPLTLDAIRKNSALQSMILLHNSRLSVQPVTDAQWKIILKLVEK